MTDTTTATATVVSKVEPHPVVAQGFTEFDLFGHHIVVYPMASVLIIGIVMFGYFLWQGQRQNGKNTFDVWDLLMDRLPDGGRAASGIKIAFQVCFFVSSWVVVDQEIKGTLTGEIYGTYNLVWAAALIAKIVFDKKDMPDLKAALKGKDE